jgi:hypothetical protein
VIDLARLGEHIHGHLAWLAVASLVHPAIVLRNARRRAHLAVGLSAGAVTLVGAIGVSLYEPYRDRLKQGIFQHAPQVGLLFERKEHLAFAAIVLAWAGAAAYVGGRWGAGRSAGVEGPALALRRFAHWAFVAAAALALATAALGTAVATYRTF